MRVQVPQDSIVLGGRNVFSPADAEIWVASPDSTIAQRADPYTRRAFRDAHPLDDNYDATNWDGNGYRILMGSLGIKCTAGDAQALIDPARTFDTVTNAPAGGINYTFSKYRMEISGAAHFQRRPRPGRRTIRRRSSTAAPATASPITTWRTCTTTGTTPSPAAILRAIRAAPRWLPSWPR